MNSSITRLTRLAIGTFAGGFVLLLNSTAWAKPMDPTLVPADAKWVIHINMDALQHSTMAIDFREGHSKAFEQARQYIEKTVGIDPREDVHGITMFSDTYDSHTGAVIIQGNIDHQALISKLRKVGDIKESTDQKWYDVTFNRERVGDTDPHSQLPNGRDTGQQHAMFAFVGSNLVIAPNQQRIEEVLNLLEGQAASLDGIATKLVPERTEGLIAWGAAVELNSIDRQDYSFAILKQHKAIVYRMGERDGKVFEETELLATSDAVAQNMKTVMEGYVALFDLYAGQQPAIKQLVQDIHIDQQGTLLDIKFEGDARTTVEALDVIWEHFSQNHSTMAQHKRPQPTPSESTVTR